MTSSQDAQHILESNHALRAWATGLRSWSQGARESASSERLRARRLVAVSAAARPARTTSGVCPAMPPELRNGPVLPSLGDVRVDELVAALVGRHHFGAMGAIRALRIALLTAGYPAESDEVLAADALDVLDTALHYPG
jgi:hypothetical protein